MSVIFASRVYIFEFKVSEMAGEENRVLNQIKDKNYSEKFLTDYRDININKSRVFKG